MSMDLMKMPPELQQRVMRELQPGEVVRWAARPDAARLMLQGFALWLFFIPWTAFSLFWIWGAAGFRMPDFSGPSAFFPLFGLPFLLIGIGGLLSPLWAQRRARHTVYVVSNQRAFMLSGWRQVTMTSWQPAQLGKITRTERPDGSGDLLFEEWTERAANGRAVKGRSGFTAVPDVRTAESFINALAPGRPS